MRWPGDVHPSHLLGLSTRLLAAESAVNPLANRMPRGLRTFLIVRSVDPHGLAPAPFARPRAAPRRGSVTTTQQSLNKHAVSRCAAGRRPEGSAARHSTRAASVRPAPACPPASPRIATAMAELMAFREIKKAQAAEPEAFTVRARAGGQCAREHALAPQLSIGARAGLRAACAPRIRGPVRPRWEAPWRARARIARQWV